MPAIETIVKNVGLCDPPPPPLPEHFHWNRTVGPSNCRSIDCRTIDSLYRHFLCTVSARRSKASEWSKLRFCQKFFIHTFNFPLNGLKLLFSLYEQLAVLARSFCTMAFFIIGQYRLALDAFYAVAFCLSSHPILYEDKWNNGKPWKNHLTMCAEFFLY